MVLIYIHIYIYLYLFIYINRAINYNIYISVYVYIYVYVCLYVSEMNYTNFTRDRRNELGLLCHCRYLHYLRVTNMEDTDLIISMIILNINDLHVSVKRVDQQTRPSDMLSTRNSLSIYRQID